MKQLKLIITALFLISPFAASADPIVITDVSQLDFDGNFVHAVNFNGNSETIGDAVFTTMDSVGAGTTNGIGISGYNRNTIWGGASNLGTSTDNNALERIMQSIIWSAGLNPGIFTVDVTQGARYIVQLLFSEGCCSNRHFNVDIAGVFQDEARGTSVGGSIWESSTTQGYAMVTSFEATSSSFTIDLSRHHVPGDPHHTSHLNHHAPGDTNYHISGFTVEQVPEPGTLALLGLGLAGMGMTRRKKKV